MPPMLEVTALMLGRCTRPNEPLSGNMQEASSESDCWWLGWIVCSRGKTCVVSRARMRVLFRGRYCGSCTDGRVDSVDPSQGSTRGLTWQTACGPWRFREWPTMEHRLKLCIRCLTWRNLRGRWLAHMTDDDCSTDLFLVVGTTFMS